MDIKLLPVEEVVKFKSSNAGAIQLDTPINVFSEDKPAASATTAPEPIINLFDTASSTKPVTSVSVTASAETAPKIEFQQVQPEPSIAIEAPHTSSGISIHLSQETPMPVAPEPSIQFDQLSVEALPTPVPVATFVAPESVPMVETTNETASETVSEAEAAKDLPYLFSEGGTTMTSLKVSKSVGDYFSGNTGIGVGESSNGDVEALKNYLTMREQDIAVLKVQLAYAREELSKSGDNIRRLVVENEDLNRKVEDFNRKNQDSNQEKAYAAKAQESELENLRIDMKAKIDKIKMLDEKLKDSADQYEKLKERVRHDIRKIRVREKELESKLEILKRDSETLIASRESKILELKRKIDLLEFNYDMLTEKSEHEKQNLLKEREKDDQVKKVLRLALGMMNEEINPAEAAKMTESKTDSENASADIDFEPEFKIA